MFNFWVDRYRGFSPNANFIPANFITANFINAIFQKKIINFLNANFGAILFHGVIFWATIDNVRQGKSDKVHSY